MSSVEHLLKYMFYKIYFYSGLFHVRRWFNKDKITILMLHGVVSEKYIGKWKPLWPRLSREYFKEKLRLLKKYYTVVSMGDAVDILSGKLKPVEHGLVLTFDDGYYNFFSDALSVISEHGIPAIVYVVPGFINKKKNYWIDRLDFVLQRNSEGVTRICLGEKIYLFDFSESDFAGRSKLYQKFRLRLKKHFDDDIEMNSYIENTLNYLECKLGVDVSSVKDDKWANLMGWDDILSVKKHDVLIGSHTSNHIRLSRVSKEIAVKELVSSKKEIEMRLTASCEHFCYPDGDSDSGVAELVKQTGYLSAVSTNEGLNLIGENVFLLKRIPFPVGVGSCHFLYRISCLMN